MKYTPTGIAGVTIVDIEPQRDDRGFFARSFCSEEFARHGLESTMVQTSISHNSTRGTVRGLHRQLPPYAEAKLVRCTRGEIFDVAVDVRADSPTYGQHISVHLNADNRRALFLPPYVAHGFQSLTDDAEVFYQISGPYMPEAQQGFRWDDPVFAISWPLAATVLSERDATCPRLESLGSTVS